MGLRKFNFSCLGHDLSFNGPDSAEEVDKLMGKDACLEAFMTLHAYQTHGPALRLASCSKLEEMTGETRGKETKTGARGGELTKYTETEQAFVNRLEAAEGDKPPAVSETDFIQILNEENEKLGDWSPTAASRNSKPAAKFYATAATWMAKVAAKITGGMSKEDAEATIKSYVGSKLGVVFESAYGEVNADNLARAAKAIEEKMQRELANGPE